MSALLQKKLSLSKGLGDEIERCLKTCNEDHEDQMEAALQGDKTALYALLESLGTEYLVEWVRPACEVYLTSEVGLETKEAKELTKALVTKDNAQLAANNAQLAAKAIQGDQEALGQLEKEVYQLGDEVVVWYLRAKLRTFLKEKFHLPDQKAKEFSSTFVTDSNLSLVKDALEGDPRALSELEKKILGPAAELASSLFSLLGV